MTDFLLVFIAVCVLGIWIGPIRTAEKDDVSEYRAPRKSKPFSMARFMGMRR